MWSVEYVPPGGTGPRQIHNRYSFGVLFFVHIDGGLYQFGEDVIRDLSDGESLWANLGTGTVIPADVIAKAKASLP